MLNHMRHNKHKFISIPPLLKHAYGEQQPFWPLRGSHTTGDLIHTSCSPPPSVNKAADFPLKPRGVLNRGINDPIKGHCPPNFFFKKNSTFNSASYIQVSVLVQSPDVSGSHPSGFPVYCFCRFIRFVQVTHENMASVHHNLKHKIMIRVKITDIKC